METKRNGWNWAGALLLLLGLSLTACESGLVPIGTALATTVSGPARSVETPEPRCGRPLCLWLVIGPDCPVCEGLVQDLTGPEGFNASVWGPVLGARSPICRVSMTESFVTPSSCSGS